MVPAASISTCSGRVLVVNCSVMELHVLDIGNFHLHFVNLSTRLKRDTLFGIHRLIQCTLHAHKGFFY
jgi:hypothetical protein